MSILLIIFVVLCVICAFRESSVTGLYKAFGVYGRIKAFLAIDLTIAGVVGILTPFIPALSASTGNAGVSAFVYLLVGVVCLAIGVLLYWTTYRKCPAMLQSRCILSMVISGMGVTVKIAVFFLGFVWKLITPREMRDEDGKTVYVLDQNVYDSSGNKVGVLTDNGNSYVRTR